MKKILVLFLFVCSITFSQTIILDDFEQGLGRFDDHIGHEGTLGVVHTEPRLDPVEPAANGFLSLRITLIDDDSSDSDWQARCLSGGGTPSNNYELDSVGVLGWWLKTSTTYLKTGVFLDAPGGVPLGTEQSDHLDVIADGEWHLYQVDLGDSTEWHPWGGAGTNGRLDKPITLDAIVFYASNEDADGDTAIVWLDLVTYTPDAVLPVELASFTASVEKNIVDLKWITASEKNNSGFEVQRKDKEETGWEKLAFVEGNGTTSDISSYMYSDQIKNAGKYFYRLKQIDYDGSFEYSKQIEVTVKTLPGEYTLAQNYPNPFNPSTSISFSIPVAGIVRLTVYNLLGEKVKEVINEFKDAGDHIVSFNAKDLSSGTYIYTLTVNNNTMARKLTLMK